MLMMTALSCIAKRNLASIGFSRVVLGNPCITVQNLFSPAPNGKSKMVFINTSCDQEEEGRRNWEGRGEPNERISAFEAGTVGQDVR